MDNYYILEDPITFVVSKTITKYRYELTDFKSSVGVSIQVWCYTVDDNFVGSFIYKVEGEEYSLWGNDDKYIDDLIKSKVIEKFSS